MKHVFSTNSKTVVTNVDSDSVQPNAVDLKLDRVFTINDTVFEISNNHKQHRGGHELVPDGDGYFTLVPGHYEVVMENVINVGEGEAGWVITRSTLNRNGCFITSGLYDSKYHGTMAGVLHVQVGVARIKRGTRIGQYLSFESEMIRGYDGDYGFDEGGAPKAMEAKYHKPTA